MEVKFYDTIEDCVLKFAVIAARYGQKWVFCKHRERDTLELPGGHREENETIEEAAKRELIEETGAGEFSIEPVCVYSVTGKTRVNETGEETFGMLYRADISAFSQELHSEIETVFLLEELPVRWTYPEIQPKLLEEVKRRRAR